MSKLIQSAVVIGATGLVGRELIKQLNQIESCERILAIVRQEDPALKKIGKVEQMVLDDFFLINDQDVQGFTHAFSCLGSTIKNGWIKSKILSN